MLKAGKLLVLGIVAVAFSSAPASAMLSRALVPKPTVTMPDSLVKDQSIQTLQEQYLIRRSLRVHGLSDNDITRRLSRLSNEQIHLLASYIRSKKANPNPENPSSLRGEVSFSIRQHF